MREDIKGLRAAVAGLGVSGTSSALALHRLGAKVTALDEKPAAAGPALQAAERLVGEGIEVITGWPGRLDPADFDVLVVSPGFPVTHPALVDMAGKVWGEIELAGRIAQAPILAVTGTNGKSTTVVLAWRILSEEGVQARLCGNIAGSGYPEMALTQAALEAGPDEVLVAEVSSFQLETAFTFRPRAAAVTNITPDHLDRHGSFGAYRDAKLRLFQAMGQGDVIVWNAESALPSKDMVEGFGAEVRAVRPSLLPSRPGGGIHFAANLAMARELAGVFAPLGQGAERAADQFAGLRHRMELVGEARGVRIYNNSMCTNPAAAAGSIRAAGGRQWVLIGGKTKGMTEADYEPLKEVLDEGHEAFIFGQDSALLSQWLGPRHRVCSSMLEGLRLALELAQPGETVHLAPGCASSEPYASFRERGEAFRKAAKEWLEQ